MEIKVKLNYLRIAPRKVRQIADAVRGKNALEAASLLQFVVRKPGLPVFKLLKSAMATAEHDFKLDPSNLYISQIFVNEGPKLKRFLPVSRGTAHPIWKRTSHIVLVLNELKPTAKKKQAKRIQVEKAEPMEIVKPEDIKKITGGENAPEKKQKFQRQEFKKQKGQTFLKRVFRRKSI